jgi:glycosyltransferase involved in cell wall biosynthesis
MRSWLRDARARIVIMSESMRTDVLQFGVPADRIISIANGVRAQALDVQRRGPEPSLLFVGRLSDEKSPLLAVDTLSELHSLGYRWRMTMVGDGPMHSAVRERAKSRNLSGAVTMAGAVEAAPYFARADLLLQTSVFEGMSNVLLEAMAHGVPFVTTASSGARDFIECAASAPPGVVCETREPRVLARAIRELLADDASRSAMGETGRRLVRDRYSIERAAEAYLRSFGG